MCLVGFVDLCRAGSVDVETVTRNSGGILVGQDGILPRLSGGVLVGQDGILPCLRGERLSFGVGDGRIQHSRVLGAYGDRQAVFQRVQRNQVAQDVASKREQKTAAAALQPFEQVGAREADQTSASAIQVVQNALFFWTRALFSSGMQVIRQPVTRQG